MNKILEILKEIKTRGGKGFLVGGSVRDKLLDLEIKDYDIEVYYLDPEDLESVLSKFGEVDLVGKSFGVYKIHGINADFSLPRKDSKVDKGHCGFKINTDPFMPFEDACRRRDLTINSIMLDPIDGIYIDPFNGAMDIATKTLRATDVAKFGEDPLRALRVAQFAARFEMFPDKELKGLLQKQVLSELSGERIAGEFEKLLLLGKYPAIGLNILLENGLLKYFPELEALVSCEQNPDWHPEGNVFQHSMLAINAATEFRTGDKEHDLLLMWSVLCHDLGKPSTTRVEDGKIKSKGHEDAGEEPTIAFLNRLKLSPDFIEKVVILVKNHLSPSHFYNNKPTGSAYRRLARRLAEKGTTLEMLEKVARSDHFGRTTPDALEKRYEAGDEFLKKAKEANVVSIYKPVVSNVVMGRHLIELGMTPGPDFKKILNKCKEMEDETGIKDPMEILRLLRETNG